MHGIVEPHHHKLLRIAPRQEAQAGGRLPEGPGSGKAGRA